MSGRFACGLQTNLHFVDVVADFLISFKGWLRLDNFHHAAWIRQQWVELGMKECTRDIMEGRKNGRGGNKRLATDMGQCMDHMVRTILPEMPNKMSKVMIQQPSYDNDMGPFLNHSNLRIQISPTVKTHTISSTKLKPARGIPSNIDGPVHLGSGGNGQNVSGIIFTLANDN